MESGYGLDFDRLKYIGTFIFFWGGGGVCFLDQRFRILNFFVFYRYSVLFEFGSIERHPREFSSIGVNVEMWREGGKTEGVCPFRTRM
jgi:hypothetical protein